MYYDHQIKQLPLDVAENEVRLIYKLHLRSEWPDDIALIDSYEDKLLNRIVELRGEEEKIREEEAELVSRIRSKTTAHHAPSDDHAKSNRMKLWWKDRSGVGDVTGCGEAYKEEKYHVSEGKLLEALLRNRCTNVELLALGKPAGDIFNPDHWMYDFQS